MIDNELRENRGKKEKQRIDMNKRYIALAGIILTLAVVLATAGCKSTDFVIVDKNADGTEIELETGQKLAIKLEGNPTTGYVWEIKNGCALLRQLDESAFEPESDLIGAPGTQTLVFEVVKTGNETLELAYNRPWEEDTPPAKTFSIKLKVD